MGAIAECLLAGIPREIVVPILPVDQAFSGKGHGKAPAKFNTSTGRWEGFEDWQLGQHDPATILKDADAAGGNCGVILGSPYGGFQFVAIDIDLIDLPRAPAWRNGMLAAIHNHLGQPLLVRETWHYRALLLLSIPMDTAPGVKTVFTLSHLDLKTPGAASQKIGKIEILAHGQQCVIAGRHISGNPISWYRYDGSDNPAPRTAAPEVQETLPRLSTFDEITSAIAHLLGEMQQFGFTHTALRAGTATGAALPLIDLAAPSANELAHLLDVMPNPTEVDRDIYISVMMAAGGARAGLAEVRGALSMQEETLIGHAIASWAVRWVPPPGSTAGTFDEELAKWQADIARPRDERYAGWRQLLMHAQAFGAPESVIRDISMEKAQDQFKADTTTAAPADSTGNTNLQPHQITLRQNVNPTLTVTSDIAVAERLLGFIAGNAAWVPATGAWLMWHGSAGWKVNEVTTAALGRMVIDRLWWYVGQYGQANPAIGQAGWPQSTMDKMMSDSKVGKVTNILKMNLAKATTDVNKGEFKLQTPNSMIDLRTLETIDTLPRKALYETRSTRFEPRAGTTPLFDKLTLDLCDGNTEVHEWFLSYMGYCLLGSPAEAVFVVVWGSGGNGKSKLAEVLQGVFGEYGVSLDANVIQESGKMMHPASLNRLRGKRLAVITELDKGAKWNERVLKQITGGDEIEARDMNKNPTPFKSQAGIIVFANDKPPIERADPSIQRRFRLIETVVRRPVTENIPEIGQKILATEANGVMSKLIHYSNQVYQKGLPPLPRAMQVAATETLSENDLIYGWLREDCEYGTAETVDCYESIDDLRKRCENYIARVGKEKNGGGMVADKLSPKDFLQRLRREGISMEDTTKPDGQGRFLRYRRKVGNDTQYTARGIKIKGLRAVAGSAVA